MDTNVKSRQPAKGEVLIGGKVYVVVIDFSKDGGVTFREKGKRSSHERKGYWEELLGHVANVGG